MTKRKTKFDSVRKDPLLQQQPGLVFDGLLPEEVIQLTDEQKATAFISRYLEVERPFSSFPEYFKSSVKGEAWELRELKTHFKNLVITEKWTEKKFISVVNSIYRDNQIMSIPSLDARGRIFDQGRLSSGKPETSSRRRGRI